LGVTIMHHVAFVLAWQLGYDLRAATIGMVYQKSLRVSRYGWRDSAAALFYFLADAPKQLWHFAQYGLTATSCLIIVSSLVKPGYYHILHCCPPPGTGTFAHSIVSRRGCCRQTISQVSTGHVVNLISNDVERFTETPIMAHFLWIAPVQLLVVSYLVWQQIGVSTLSGMGALSAGTAHGVFIERSVILSSTCARFRDC